MATRILALLQLAVISTWWVTFSGCERSRSDKSDDERLAHKIADAIRNKLPIDKIEEFVGQRATINTTRGSEKDLFDRAAIEVYSKESQITDLRNVQDVVYWVRPVKSEECKIIGVAWMPDGQMKLFSGFVGPP